MAWPLLLALGLAGLVVGSFLTAFTHRLKTREPVVWDRSRCPRCRHVLSPLELLPVLSFIVQGGRCRSCRSVIALRYPAIELAAAGLFLIVGWRAITGAIAPPPFAAGMPEVISSIAYYAFFAAIAIAVSVHDFERQLVPLTPIRMLWALGLGAQIVGALRAHSVLPLVVAGAISALSFSLLYGIWRVSNGRAMGRGDADVAGAVTMALSPGIAGAGLLLAFWLGAAAGVVLMATRRFGWQSRLPLAPFLFSGAIAAFLAPNLASLVLPYGF